MEMNLMEISIGSFVLFALLFIAASVDVRFFIVPNHINLSILLSGIGFSYLTGVPSLGISAGGILCGGGSLLLICIMFRLLRGYDGMGMGDVKLLGAAGAWIGWYGIAPVLFLSSVMGLIFALAAGFKINARKRLAFAPFLGVAIFCTWLLQVTQLAPWVP